MRAFRDQARRLAHSIDGSSTQLTEWMGINATSTASMDF